MTADATLSLSPACKERLQLTRDRMDRCRTLVAAGVHAVTFADYLALCDLIHELPALICQGDEAAIMEYAGRFDALVAKVAPGGEVVS